MPEFNRRNAMTTVLVAGASMAALTGAAEAQDSSSKDRDRIMAAGLSKEEADCWEKTAAAAAAFFQLPELHPADKQEVAAAIHIIQNKLLGRPTYRNYLQLAKEDR